MDWYGENDAFGEDGNYEILTFDNNSQQVKFERNYIYTLTLHTGDSDPNSSGVGSDYESWNDF